MSVQTLSTDDGFAYRDLNKNGRLDPYEDPRVPIEERVEDLLGQMTLEEKAGMLFQTMIAMNPDGTLNEGGGDFPTEPTTEMVSRKLMNHFNILYASAPRQIAEWYNRLQALAGDMRLGIPVTISTDPRHAFSSNPGASFLAGAFSQWPEPLGLAAINDPALVEEFGDMARQEYTAVGIRVALHPMADLATEPRWARINGTFGEDAERSGKMTAAYIRGFQGERIGPESVSCMVKHFPGGGPQKDGEDPHFTYGREQVYPGNNFDYHLQPFEDAFAAGVSQVMPYYGMPVGLPIEEVGFGFNKDVITGLLRQKYAFDGIVCTDWGLLTDADMMGEPFPARSWGVEHLSIPEKAKKVLDAGVDQFGGEACPEVIIDLVRSGQIPESRLDISVRRLLREKFRLGLFDQPFVDPDAAERIVGNERFQAAGALAQRKAFVLLKNATGANGPTLPLSGKPKIYIENIAPDVASAYGEVVATPAEADLAILRLQAPFQPPKGGGFLANFFHSGDLDFKEEELTRILNVLRQVPTIVNIYLDRPAVMPEIAEHSAALLANFGASDAALLDVVFGRVAPQGTLPFELPSSMEAVRKQKSDVPYDSEQPLFPFGHGLSY
ncbi:beta-glucosidase [Ktedonobacter sp. SOSP1-85]|uniref:glycoside hydrolase family 3 protein n=1 Tax=Ktedonobacter sp. SOSP1-85 TaxID=2778367 RepID=UPI001915F440|nr:glycoside hydrolase family 3 N-terminal domain-containing protein [Ktedonobacter sp. SOSP1-85]GHO76570.1 beta-glucosidase [Ktedonobacter sp. SOSP1-85]